MKTMKARYLSILSLVAATTSASADTLTLRVADSLPNNHIIHQTVTRPFMEAVKKASHGQIAFQHFPGEQLGKAKDLLALTRAGLADIGYVGPSYISDKMPLSSALELSGAFADHCQASRAVWNLTHDGGYLERKEFAPNHIVALVTLMLPTYQILLSNTRNVETLKDLSGLKVRSAGGAMDFVLKDLNMVPVRMTPPEIYEALSRGTIDGALFPFQSANAYGLIPKLKSGTYKENFGTVVLTYSMGETRWKRLPEDVREILMEAGKNISLSACKSFLKTEQDMLKKALDTGMKTIEFNAADETELATKFAKAAQDWAASLDKRGKPGTETLVAVRKAMSDEKQ